MKTPDGWIAWLRGRSLYSKTVLGMLAISLTVLILTASILLLRFRAEMTEGYRELTRASMGNTDAMFRQILVESRERTMQWYTDSDSVYLRLSEDADYVQRLSFVNEIYNFLMSSSYIQSVCIVNRRISWESALPTSGSFSPNLPAPKCWTIC
ncbi:MAG: hypothetical protein Q4C65_13450 [Eubacteriales bacterium]|nr:hypothetical protein [Eubacteriales bacterium]